MNTKICNLFTSYNEYWGENEGKHFMENKNIRYGPSDYATKNLIEMQDGQSTWL